MDLIKELKQRNSAYVESSKEIISVYSDFLDQVFLKLSESAQNQEMVVDWSVIDFHRSNPLLVSVIGVATYNIGAVVQLPGGDVVYVDESNKDNFRQPLKLLLPLKELSSQVVDDSVTFVKEYTTLLEYMDPDEIDMYIGEKGFLQRHFTAFGKDADSEESQKTTEELSPPKPLVIPKKDMHNDFDLSLLDLDEAQIASLKLMDSEGKA